MTLTTHGVVGAALASTLAPHSPSAALLVAFGSHFLLDALPHWDYPLRSATKDPANELNNDLVLGRAFLFDLVKIGLDFCLGLALGLVIAGSLTNYFWPVAGALAAMLPDFLQFVYFKWRRWPLTALQRFHLWIHTCHRLTGRPFLGIVSQLLLILAVWFLVDYY
jgi:hypothetical protein